MSRDNNLGMWSTGPNGGEAGLGSGYQDFDDYSGGSALLSTPSTYALFPILSALSCLLSFHHIIALTSML